MQFAFVYLLITLISFPSRAACRKQDNAVFYSCNLLETAALTAISASTGHQICVLFLYDYLSTWLRSGTYFRTKKRAAAHRLIIHLLGFMYHKVTHVYLSKFITLLSSWNPRFHKGALYYIYRIIHKSFRDFRPLRYSSRDGQAEGEHVNRGRDTPSFCPTLQVLYVHPW